MALTQSDMDALQEMINIASRSAVEQAIRQATTVKPMRVVPAGLVYTRQNQEYYSPDGRRFRKFNGTLLEIPTED